MGIVGQLRKRKMDELGPEQAVAGSRNEKWEMLVEWLRSRCEACEGAPRREGKEGHDEGVQKFGRERKDRVDALAKGVDDIGGQVESVKA